MRGATMDIGPKLATSAARFIVFVGAGAAAAIDDPPTTPVPRLARFLIPGNPHPFRKTIKILPELRVPPGPDGRFLPKRSGQTFPDDTKPPRGCLVQAGTVGPRHNGRFPKIVLAPFIAAAVTAPGGGHGGGGPRVDTATSRSPSGERPRRGEVQGPGRGPVGEARRRRPSRSV